MNEFWNNNPVFGIETKERNRHAIPNDGKRQAERMKGH
jgi:hypothetical protein